MSRQKNTDLYLVGILLYKLLQLLPHRRGVTTGQPEPQLRAQALELGQEYL